MPKFAIHGNLACTRHKALFAEEKHPAENIVLDLGFLFAAIDTWDGTDVLPGFPSPDFFNVTVDGVEVFRESFRNLLPQDDPFCDPGEICQSYVPPTDGQIPTGGTNLFGNIGFSGNTDGAYDMFLEPAFRNIAHTADSITIQFFGIFQIPVDSFSESPGGDRMAM